MTKKVKLTEILEMVEFDYVINNDGTLSLRDQLGANLGNIESDTFEIDKNLAILIVDRLSTYIEDYITEGYAETLNVECNENADKSDTYEDLLSKMKKYPDKFSKGCIRIMEALDLPNELLDISEIIENSKITKSCFRCGTRLMKSPVEGYTYYCHNCNEDFYEFEQKGV
jgi:hypothetical protein